MKNSIKKSIENGKFFSLIALLFLALMFVFFWLTATEETLFNFHSWNEIGMIFFLSLSFPSFYLWDKFEENQKRVHYFRFSDGLLLFVLGVLIFFWIKFEEFKGSNLLSLGFVLTILLWTLAILFVCFKNKKLKIKLAEAKLAEAKRIAHEKQERESELNLILSSFFFGNKDTKLPAIKDEVEAEEIIEFAQLCLDLTSLEEPFDLMDTLKEAIDSEVEDKKLLTAVVALRLAQMRGISISELYKLKV